ncbi:hypothetical protein [Natronobeatus ordinarius]|uniref:hypothetical protein n=1 Tax=Natronobeatus ordinarius TaxID=2963433 RepID=UPI0020CBF46D|nr:hypothetical protein [Natronobeatus ordinarius]
MTDEHDPRPRLARPVRRLAVGRSRSSDGRRRRPADESRRQSIDANQHWPIDEDRRRSIDARGWAA